MIFRNWILENFPFLEDDFDALTDYQLFCKMMEYVKQFAKDNKEFNDRLTALENYINNLDLQVEVNNKLDEMAESGELAEIVSQYLQLATTFTYKTVNDMKASENLINGSFARTKGFYTFDDGGGANYYIRNITNEDVIDNIHLFAITYDVDLVAELLEDNKINILQLGAKNDIDNTNIINYALTNFNEVIVPDDTFSISNSLILKDYNYLHGFNENSVISMDKQYTMPMLIGSNINNIKIENICFTNGESDTSSGVPINSIGNFEGCNYLDFRNIKLQDIYSLGLVFKDSGYINIVDSIFYQAGHSMISFLTETHDILIDNCVLDTITGTDSNPYLLSTGSNDYVTQVDYLTKNMIVQNSTFKNNPLWEGLESHGCSNFTAINNKIYNCKQGIHVYFDDRTPTVEYDYQNVTIKNNIIKNDNNVNLQYGVIVGGTSSYYLKNVNIENNTIEGGSTSASMSIYLIYCNYFNIINNKITKFKYQAMQVQLCTNGNITNNYIYNPATSGTGGIAVGGGAWLVQVNNNIINGDNNITRCITTSNAKGLAIVGHNYCYNYTQFKYYSGNANNTMFNISDTTSSKRLGCKGIYSVNDYDMPLMYCTDDVIKSVAETSTAKATATLGENIVTSTNAIQYLCPGQEIVISGAASGGSDLTTIIDEFIGSNQFTIKDTISTSVTNANIATTASTWVAL